MQNSERRFPTPRPALAWLPPAEPQSDRLGGGDAAREQDRYANGAVSFLPPAEWRSVAIFTAPVTAGSAVLPTITMTRERLRPGETLRMHLDRLLSSIGKAVQGLHLLQSGSCTVAGRSALIVRFALTGGAAPLEHTIVMVDPLGDPMGATIFHASGPRDASSSMRQMLETLLESVRFGASQAPPPASVARPVESHAADVIPFIPMPGYRASR
jgi:hypothetical protein